MARPTTARSRNQLRIIAGKWRGRKIQFTPVENLRPTPDRVRETIFNWLQFDIAGKHCLDLFAGSGVLGLEALSRGATKLTSVESHPIAVKQLNKNIDNLKAENCHIVAQDAIQFLEQNCPQPYEVIFLDPPYRMQILKQCIELIEKNQWLTTKGSLYFELPRKEPELELSAAWVISHKKSAGNISYHLATFLGTQTANQGNNNENNHGDIPGNI